MNPYLKNLKTIVFDIETMGLMPNKDMVISASFCDPKTMSVTQFFSENKSKEKDILLSIYKELDQYDVVITYNGDRFDLPFIATRAKKYGIKHVNRFWSIDMYRYLKKYWQQAKLMPHLNQKSVEVALGLSTDRTDEIGGGECIPLYQDYILNCNDEAKELILLHNADDVRQLSKIYNKVNFLPFDQISFEMGFGIKADRLVLCNGIRLDKNYLYAELTTSPGGIPSQIYQDNFEFEYDCLTGDISIKILLETHENLRFVDLNKLPIKTDSLSGLQGYHSDFLVLSEGSNLKYQEINELVKNLIVHGGLI